jgi:Tfp pilus assembly protein PilV
MMLTKIKKTMGFSLIETLIALFVFSSGIIGVSFLTGSAIRASADEGTTAAALSTMSQLLIPLYVAAATGPTEFKTALDLFDNGGLTVTSNNGLDTFNIIIAEAQDDAGNNIINDVNPENWVSPITVGVQIVYAGLDETEINTAPFTFLIKPI